MKCFTVCIAQSYPDYISEHLLLFANDITEAMVLGLDLVSLVREAVIAKGIKPERIANLCLTEVAEDGVIMTVMPTESSLDKNQIETFARVLIADLD